MIRHRNKSPHGWWFATCLERFEYFDENRSNSNRRCIAWENPILLKANDRNEDYKKAIEKGKLSEGSESEINGRKGTWIFEGLTSLIPIYEELDDGAEILIKRFRCRVIWLGSYGDIKENIWPIHKLAY
ncbi:MAG: DUF4288 domain-containing protein [Desulfobacterales bacterium]